MRRTGRVTDMRKLTRMFLGYKAVWNIDKGEII